MGNIHWAYSLIVLLGILRLCPGRPVSGFSCKRVAHSQTPAHHRHPRPKPPWPPGKASPPGASLCGPPQGGSSSDSSSGQEHWPQSVHRGHSRPPPPCWPSQARAVPVIRWWGLGRTGGGKDQLTGRQPTWTLAPVCPWTDKDQGNNVIHHPFLCSFTPSALIKNLLSTWHSAKHWTCDF